MHIGWPQAIYLALSFMGTGMALAKHGEPKGTWNFGGAILEDIFILPLLWWGGFFS